jgi:hypothetical protein
MNHKRKNKNAEKGFLKILAGITGGNLYPKVYRNKNVLIIN